MRLVKFAIALMLLASPALAQVATPGLPLVALGYCQLTSIDASTALSSCSGGIPTGANTALIVSETQAVRYRDDGVAPTSSAGFPVAVGTTVLYSGALSKLLFISQTSGAKLNVLFYKSP